MTDISLINKPSPTKTGYFNFNKRKWNADRVPASIVIQLQRNDTIIYMQYSTLNHIVYHFISINRLASLWGRPNTSEKQPYITIISNPSKEKKSFARPIYIQNPVNGRFWLNLGFRNVGS